MSNQKRRLRRLGNLPAILRSEVVPFDSVEIVSTPLQTHYIPAFTQRRADGSQRAFCDSWVFETEFSTEPTCPLCVRAMDADAAALDGLVDKTVTARPAPRYTVEARGEFWIIRDADGHVHGLPNVYDTFTSVQRALECAHTLNTSVWGYRKPVPVPARALETALDQPLRLVAPDRHRDATPDMRDNRCVCGVRVTRHYDGWDGTRLSCDEALRRHGLV
jgi:hypothetical protein